jgi:hypothetical protein
LEGGVISRLLNPAHPTLATTLLFPLLHANTLNSISMVQATEAPSVPTPSTVAHLRGMVERRSSPQPQRRGDRLPEVRARPQSTDSSGESSVVPTGYQSRAGPIRAAPGYHSRLYQPYRAPPIEHVDEEEEADQSTSTPRNPSVGSSTARPFGGQSKTTADAEKQKDPTEEDDAPVSHFYHGRVPRVSNRSFGVRRQRKPGLPRG